MTQFSFEWILSLNCLSQKWGQVQYFPDEPNSTMPRVSPGGLTVVGAKVVDRINPLKDGSQVPIGGTTLTLRREGKKGITVNLRTSKGACEPVQVDPIEPVADNPAPLPTPIRVEMFPVISAPANHPQATAPLPPGYKLIGGGALANWVGRGALLISSYPSGNSWVAQSKDHVYPDVDPNGLTTITVWAIGLYDPDDKWDVKVQPSTPVPYHPSENGKATATLPDGYSLTGGGAIASPENPGILLNGSYPLNLTTWQASAHDHTVQATGSLTAYIIGIKARQGITPRSKISAPAVSPSTAHPTFSAPLEDGLILTGGGAYTQCALGINLLTGSYPFGTSAWRGEAKDHIVSCESPITVFSIGLEAGPGSYFGQAKEAAFSAPQYNALATNRIAASVGGQPTPQRALSLMAASRYTYVTQSHDTLRIVALKVYRNQNWRKILDANRSVVQDPNKIKPGTRLSIPAN